MSWITFDFNAFIPKRIVISDSINSFDIEFYLSDWDRLIPINLHKYPFLKSFAWICHGSKAIIEIPYIMESENEKNFNVKWIDWIAWDIYWEDVEQNVIQIHNFCNENYQENWIKINNKKYTWLPEIHSILHELHKHLLIDPGWFISFDRKCWNNYHLIKW